MPAFNSRITPKEFAGMPAAVFYYGLPAALLAIMSLFDVFLIRLICIPAAVTLATICIYDVVNHKDALLMGAKRVSRREVKSYTLIRWRY